MFALSVDILNTVCCQKLVFSIYTFRPDALRTPTKMWLQWHRVVLYIRHIFSLLYTCSFPACMVLKSVCIFVHDASGLAYSTLPSVRGASTTIRGQSWPVLYVYTQYQMTKYTAYVEKPNWNGPLSENRTRWEDNIKINLEEVGQEGAEWIGASGGLSCSVIKVRVTQSQETPSPAQELVAYTWFS